jgi:hypothetical protein
VTANEFLYDLHPDPVISFFDPLILRRRPGATCASGPRRHRVGDRRRGHVRRRPGEHLLRAGTAYQRYEAEGRDWTRHGSRTGSASRKALPWRFALEVVGSYSC